MRKLINIVSSVFTILAVSFISNAKDISHLNPENILVIEIESPLPTGSKTKGKLAIIMKPNIAPNHVKRIKELARKKFYDGILFHRVIENFMAQTGDPTGTGRSGSGQKIDAEFTSTPHLRGTVSMARGAAGPNANEEEIEKANNSADSQFFICFTRRAELDKKYTVWGRVIAGMQITDTIPRGEPPYNPAKMNSVRVAADIPNWASISKNFK